MSDRNPAPWFRRPGPSAPGPPGRSNKGSFMGHDLVGEARRSTRLVLGRVSIAYEGGADIPYKGTVKGRADACIGLSANHGENHLLTPSPYSSDSRVVSSNQSAARFLVEESPYPNPRGVSSWDDPPRVVTDHPAQESLTHPMGLRMLLSPQRRRQLTTTASRRS